MIFEPFRGCRSSDTSHARGLGLYIAKQIVAAHGGDIDVRSTATNGTTFTVRVSRRSAVAAPRDDRTVLPATPATS